MYTIECMARLHILSIDWVVMFQTTNNSFLICDQILYSLSTYKVHLKRSCLFNGRPEGYLLKSHLRLFASKFEVIPPQFHIEWISQWGLRTLCWCLNRSRFHYLLFRLSQQDYCKLTWDAKFHCMGCYKPLCACWNFTSRLQIGCSGWGGGFVFLPAMEKNLQRTLWNFNSIPGCCS